MKNLSKSWKELAKMYKKLYEGEMRANGYDLSRYKEFILALDTSLFELGYVDKPPRVPMEYSWSYPELLIKEKKRVIELENEKRALKEGSKCQN